MVLQNQIDLLDTMYPSFNVMLDHGSEFVWPLYANWSSIYGYSFGNNVMFIDKKEYLLSEGQYFSFFIKDTAPKFDCESKLFIVCRLGYKCQNTMGWIESQGRLCYIDGCTDSLLIYPPRLGDPSLSLLHFPAGINQTQHLHPSIRLGCVIDGHGKSEFWEHNKFNTTLLTKGQNFCLLEKELHRFCTTDSSMTVIAWHPDGDWGPTDHNHTMLNRTYLR